MTPTQRKHSAVLGGLVADAASMGFHWLYDADRLADVADEHPEFAAPDPKNYAGVAGYFAHGHKQVGDLTHYGEQLAVALRSLAANDGTWDAHHYLAEFRATFERGGSFHGYIDAATTGTLNNAKKAEAEAKEAAKKTGEDADAEQWSAILGADDNQIPAFSKLPPIVARYAGDPRLPAIAEEAVRVTNNNDEAVAYALFAAKSLERVILGAGIPEALRESAAESSDTVREKVEEALSLDETRPAQIGQHFGPACYVSHTIPVSVAILRDSTTYAEGVRRNILAAGDNAGRSIFVGAMLGAAGGIGSDGIPPAWLSRLTNLAEFVQLTETAISE